MPLLSSQSAANVYRQAAAPNTPTTGDAWIDTDNGQIFTYNGTTWIQQTGGAYGTALQLLRTNAGVTALEYGAGISTARLEALA